MVYQIKDIDVWEDFKSGVNPDKNVHTLDIPKRLSVSYKPTPKNPYQIDLHGLTVQQAFDKVKKTLSAHYKKGSRRILIITGKGTTGKGLIKNEFAGWMENPKLAKYIRAWRWQNAGGAAVIELKKNL